MRRIFAGNPLKIVCAAGLGLALIVSWCLVLFVLFWGPNAAGGSRAEGNAFARSLAEYDLLDAPSLVPRGEDSGLIERKLSALQKEAGSVEEQLSVLKRRRALAFIDRSYTADYREASREAAEKFPNSAPLAAAAAEALLLDGSPNEESVSAPLQTYASRVFQNRFDFLALSLHVLAGNLDDPGRAAGVPGMETLLSLDFSGEESPFPAQVLSALQKDRFLLLANKGDIPGAEGALESLLPEESPREEIPEDANPGDAAPSPPPEDLLRMGAEFYYDHDLPHRAAELFLALRGDADNARAADALVLSGEIEGARNIWRALSSGGQAAIPREEDSGARQIWLRSLYNMAASAANREEETFWLERLFPAQSPETGNAFEDSLRCYSVIRYSRLLDDERAIALLDDESMKQDPLLDLELLRRKLGTWPAKRAAAEVWLLLGRHAENEAVYRWAARYFEHQKLFTESAQLLKEAGRKNMYGSWLELHRGFALIREGKSAEAEKIFREASDGAARGTGLPSDPENWLFLANLGRIEEERRALSQALARYEAAAAEVNGRSAAARIQMRLARCLEALDRIEESRRALEYARELDPGDINIRRELRRLESGL